MSKDWGRSESKFKLIECISALLGEISGEAFACEPSEWDSDGRISINKSLVKVCKTEEGLDVADFARFGPIVKTQTRAHAQIHTHAQIPAYVQLPALFQPRVLS